MTPSADKLFAWRETVSRVVWSKDSAIDDDDRRELLLLDAELTAAYLDAVKRETEGGAP